MRRITSDAHEAFVNNRRFKQGNTEVVVEENGDVKMLLFGSEIVKKVNGEVFISTANYPNNTTLERLRAFVIIGYRKGKLMLDNKYEWDGNWVNLNLLEEWT